MEKNQEFTVTIEDMSEDGSGIGKLDGYIWFIKDTVIGDQVRAKAMKMKKSYGFARLMEVITPSAFRTEPRCPAARPCGGCQLQAMKYEEQLAFKERKIKNNLMRIGGFKEEEIPMFPIIGMEEPWRYRNKAQFPFGMNKNGEIITGFYAGRTHDIIENADCLLGVQENRGILEIIKAFMKEYRIRPYDEKSHQGLVRHALIRKGFKSGEIMVCLVINGKRLPHGEELVKRLSAVSGMTSISYSINEEKTNVIMGKEIVNLYGPGYITDNIGNVTYQISPLSFYQVNPVQTEILYQTAIDYAGLTGKETVIDAYCGIGTIGLIAAKKAGKVIGVELNKDAVKDARINAKENKITNAAFYQGDAGRFMVEMAAKGEKADVVFMDPPRAGSDERFLSSVVKLSPKKVIYISCNPETLARDLKYLTKHHYKVEKIQPVDMFPFCDHVETVCSLSRK